MAIRSLRSLGVCEKQDSGCFLRFHRRLESPPSCSQSNLVSWRTRFNGISPDDGKFKDSSAHAGHYISQVFKENVDEGIRVDNSQKRSGDKLRKQKMSTKQMKRRSARTEEGHVQFDSKGVSGQVVKYGMISSPRRSPCHIELKQSAINQASVEKNLNNLGPTAPSRAHHRRRRGFFGCKSIDIVEHGHDNGTDRPSRLNKAAEAVLNQKLQDRKHPDKERESQQSKQLLDALGIFNSNQELFIKLLQDPNSLLVKRIENPHGSQANQEQGKAFSGVKLSECLRGKSRGCESPLVCQNLKPSDRLHSESDDPQASETIVVLKPLPSGLENSEERARQSSSTSSDSNFVNNGRKVGSTFFSFTHLKRKLRQFMKVGGKDGNSQSTGGMSDKFAYNSEDSKRDAKEMDVTERRPSGNSDIPVRGMSRLSQQSQKKNRVGKTEEFDLLPARSSLREFGKSQMDYWKTRLHKEKDGEALAFSEIEKDREQVQLFDAEFKNSEVPFPEAEVDADCSILRGSAKIIPLGDIEHQDEFDPFRSSCHRGRSSACESTDTTESCEEHSNTESSRLDFSMTVRSSRSSMGISSSLSGFQSGEGMKDRKELSSPAAADGPVLIHACSPANFIPEPDSPVQSPQINIESMRLSVEPANNVASCGSVSISDHVVQLLQASRLKGNELLMKCPALDDLSSPSLIDDRLLVDYVNEILEEAYRCCVRCYPLSSSVKACARTLDVETSLLNAVMKRVDCKLLQQPPPHSIDQITEQDLMRYGTWLDEQTDTAEIVVETAEFFLEELVTEAVAELNF